jgi:Asp/Glu/hydantoin racemase
MPQDSPVVETSQLRPCRIWYQSFVDPQEQRPYMQRLQERLTTYASPGVQFEVHGMSPPDRYLSSLTEFRCAAQTIRNVLQAQQQGYDAFVIGHFQEPGLVQCRTVVDIPVVGLGEATMLQSCTLGQTFGLITINPVFIPWHREQIVRLGLQQRATGVLALDTQVTTYIEAFEQDAAYQQVREAFRRHAQQLVEQGAEVIIPAGGLPMLLFARESNFTIQHPVVLNGIATVAVMAEAAVRLHRLTGAAVSRQGTFAKAPPEAIEEFLASLSSVSQGKDGLVSDAGQLLSSPSTAC